METLNKFVAGAKANKKRALLVLFNIVGLIAVITTSSIEVVAKINPLYIIWFIPVCIVVVYIGVRIGLRINKRIDSK